MSSSLSMILIVIYLRIYTLVPVQGFEPHSPLPLLSY
jgi:hypothetical protein